MAIVVALGIDFTSFSCATGVRGDTGDVVSAVSLTLVIGCIGIKRLTLIVCATIGVPIAVVFRTVTIVGIGELVFVSTIRVRLEKVGTEAFVGSVLLNVVDLTP